MNLTTITIDSPLGSWTHSEWRPPHLAWLVEMLWHFDGRTTMPRERIFPGPHVEMILQLGPRFSAVEADGRVTDPFPLTCLSGLALKPAVIQAPEGGCCVLGIRLKPVGAYALLGPCLAKTTGLTVDLNDLAQREGSELAERCHDAATVEARFTIVTQWISSRLARSAGVDRAIAWTAERLELTSGMESITALQNQTGIPRARFIDVFRRHTGLTPKRYARVLRFRRALLLVQQGQSLSDVAATTGYFDQSHMNADFLEFAEMTPMSFMRAARYPNSPSLPESA